MASLPAMSGASYEDLAGLLNPEQLRAATTIDGPLLILAGAGSGKTRVLVHRAAHILHEGRAQPWELFLVTFTNKAAKEMRERLEKLIGPEVRSAWIGTFHALCARMLRQEGYRLGYNSSFTIYDSDDSKRLVKKIMGEMEFDSSNYALSPPQIISAIDRAKNKGLTPEAYKSQLSHFATPAERAAVGVYFRYREALRRANAMDFGDLLLITVELMKHHAEARQRFAERFRYVMVDEFQDTNQVQYEVLRQLVSVHKNLAVVGDDDQSIYRWRGAEVSNILGFSKAHAKATVVKLEQNYRSTANIITAANAVIRQNSKRHDKTLFTDSDAGAPVGLAMFDYSDAEARFIVGFIQERVAHGEDPTSFAILYRQNAQSRAFEEQLMRHRVPYVLIGGTGFYDRREVKDILAYLRLTANPRSRADFERIINVPSRKIGATTLARLRSAAEATGAEGAELLALSDETLAKHGLKGAVVKRLRQVRGLLEDLRTFAADAEASQVAAEAISLTDYEAYLDKSDPNSAEDRRANVQELVSSISEHEKVLGGPAFDPGDPSGDDGGFGLAGAKTPLQAFLDQASLTSGGEEGEVTEGVNLLTLHSAKGLEFPIVFMVGMEENTFPSRRVIESDDREAIEEERRLCYVGVTRAMKEIHLSAARVRRIYGQEEARPPSRFLAELPPSVVANMPLTVAQLNGAPAMGMGLQAVAAPAVRAENRGSDRIEYDRPMARHSAATAQAGPSEHPQVGEQVHHNLFGVGLVIARDAPGSSGRLTIQFGDEQKRVISKYVEKTR